MRRWSIGGDWEIEDSGERSGVWDWTGRWGGDGFVGRVSESGLWGLVCGETSLGDFLILCGFRRF